MDDEAASVSRAATGEVLLLALPAVAPNAALGGGAVNMAEEGTRPAASDTRSAAAAFVGEMMAA